MNLLVFQRNSCLKLMMSVLLTVVGSDVFAQYNSESISLEGDMTQWYDQQIGWQNTVLQHGELAALTRKSPNSHAYYKQSTWVQAKISYCNQSFSGVPALYDIENDRLIIKNNMGTSFAAFPLELRKEQVQYFEIEESRFVYVNEPVSWHQGGFFKAVYEGDSIALLSKIYKRLELKYGILTYQQTHQYFIKKEGVYHRLKRFSGLLRLFPEYKRDIRQYKKELSLRRISNPSNEDKLALLIAYCENLNQQ